MGDQGWLRAIAWSAAAAAVLVPLLFDLRGKDVFRDPKEVVFRAFALLIIALTGPAIAAGWRFTQRLREPATMIPLLVLAWTAVTTLASTNRLLSSFSLITVAASVVLFYGSRAAGSRLGMTALDLALVPATMNAVLVVLQEFKIWQPFPLADRDLHIASTALIGNPNDVGTFLLFPAVATAAASFFNSGKRRVLYGTVAVILLAGLIASATRTALVAYACALLVFAFTRSFRVFASVLILLAIAATLALTSSPTLVTALEQSREAFASRRYDLLFSERLPPFLAAAEMARDHPIFGAGPGTFKWHYMPYRMEIARDYPPEVSRGWPMNFGETHNDHLQVAAETGIIGYVLFIAAILVVAFPAFRRRKMPESVTAQLGRALRLPISTAFFIVALGQFPLQIAAPRLEILFFAALCVSWDHV